MGSLRRSDDTGLVLYVILRDASHQVVIQSTGVVEAYDSAHWSTYAHTATEQGASGYYYATTSNSLTAGVYWIEWKYRVGASPAVSDPVRASGSLYWSGASWWIATVDVGAIKTVDADTAITTRVDASTLAGKFTGVTMVANWLRGLFRKDAMDATAKSEVNDGGGAFDEATDSAEAIRDRGDAAYLTATGFPTKAEMVAAFTEIKGATWNGTTDSLEKIRDRGDTAWVTGSAASLTAADIWGLADGIETGVTPKQALQRIGAVVAGKVSGAGTGTEIFVGMDGVTTRVKGTVDIEGNRTTVEYA